MKKKIILTFLLLVFIPVSMMAYDISWSKLYYNVDENTKTAEVTYKSESYNSYTGNVEIPATFYDPNRHVTYTVTSIGENAFRNCSNLTSVTIPDGVTSIGNYAFSGCSNLTSVSIPSSVTSLGNYVFQICSKLTSVTIGNSVTSIGNYAFSGCSSLTSVSIPSSVTSIGNSAFNGCTSLARLTIGDSVTSIGSSAFNGCTSLASVTIPNSVTSIGRSAFYGCSGLTSLTLSNSLTSIENSVFADCKSLTSVAIPASVTSIGWQAFEYCTRLRTVTIPDGLTSIGGSAFAGCDLSSFTIPAGLTSIESGTFSQCFNLSSVTIPNGVTTIGSSAFYQCSLTSITIPPSVTTIDTHAFYGCANLTTVTAENPTPVTINGTVFTNRTNATLYVPSSGRTSYRNADYWKEFKYIYNIDRTEQSLSLSSLPTMTYGDESYSLPAKTSQNLTLTWTSSDTDVAEVNGNILTVKNAGSATITALQDGNSSYLSFSKAYTLTVAKKLLAIKAGSYERDEGEDNPEMDVTYEGFVNGDDASCLTQLPQVTCYATISSIPGTYTIYVSGAESPNYKFTYIHGTLTVKAKESYAYLSGNTLTFYHDSKRSTRYNYNYSCYLLNSGSYTPNWCTSNNQGNITRVVFDSSFANARPQSCYGWFYNFSNLTSISGLEYLNTSKVTDMHGMFAYCSRLQLLDVSHFDTGKVTDMREMFEGCSSLLSLDVSGFSTSNVTSMYAMFDGCSSLGALDVSGFNTGKVTSMDNMFNGCSKLTGLDLGGFDASKTNTIYNIFTNCSGLISLTLSNKMSKLGSDACSGVGIADSPCQLTVPGDFDFGDVETSGSCFQWKGGFFKANFTSVVVTGKSYIIQYGDTIPTLEYTAQGATLNGTPSLSCSATSTSSVGTYPITVSQGSVTNSNATYVDGKLTITKAPLTVTAKSYTIRRGDPMPVFEAEYAGFVNNENVDVLSSQPAMTTTATSVSNVGTYDIAVSGAEAQNYDFTYVKGTLTITKAPLTITAIDCEREEGYENPEFSVTYDGFINGETSDVLTTQPTITCAATAESAPGTYDINVSGAETANYDITYVSGTLTILQRVSYAIFDGTTLTFYHDAKQAVREGTAYALNTGTNLPGWYVADGSSPVTKVVFDSSFDTVRPTSTCGWFMRMASLTTIEGIEYLHTDEVTTMMSMFYNCSSLTALDVSGFNTAKVIHMGWMFYNCSSLTALDVSGFNTAKVVSMANMFYNCCSLTALDVSGFKTAKVTNMNGMFHDCISLGNIDLSSFNTANVTNMNGMFHDCISLGNIDLSSFNTANVTDMGAMFQNCKQFTAIDLSHFDTGKVTEMGRMFKGSTKLTSLDLSSFDTTSLTSSNEMLMECTALTSLTLPACFSSIDANACTSVGTETNPCELYVPDSFDFSDVDTSASAFQWKGGWFHRFSETYVLLSTDSKTLSFYSDNSKNVREGTVYELNTGTNLPGWYVADGSSPVIKVVFDSSFDVVRPTSTFSWFFMKQLTTIEGLEYLHTDEVTNMGYMFWSCNNLATLDVTHFNTSKVRSMRFLFAGMESLTSLDVSHFDTSNVTDMMNMFQSCSKLTSLDVTHFDTSKVTGMRSMFYNCKLLTDLDVSGFVTENVTNMSHMFRDCAALTSIDVSGFNTTKVTEMEYMFNGCNSLQSVDLRGFSTRLVQDMSYMFNNCKALTSLDLSSFNMDNVTNTVRMLNGCSSLANLTLSLGFSGISDDAYTYVGTEANPCKLNVPDSFDFGDVDTSASAFQWKSGWFSYDKDILLGDVNHDMMVTITDVMMTVNAVVSARPAGFYPENADMNGDHDINISDIMMIVKIVVGN